MKSCTLEIIGNTMQDCAEIKGYENKAQILIGGE